MEDGSEEDTIIKTCKIYPLLCIEPTSESKIAIAIV